MGQRCHYEITVSAVLIAPTSSHSFGARVVGYLAETVAAVPLSLEPPR